MANLLVEIGNTAVKAAWSEGVTLGKVFRYQGEKVMDFILSITEKEKPEALSVISSLPLEREDEERLRKECTFFIPLNKEHTELLLENGLPEYLSYDRAAAIQGIRYLFNGKSCTVCDLGTTINVDFIDKDGKYLGGNISLGCRTRFNALNRYSRSLPLVNTPKKVPETGTSVVSSMEAGVVFGIMFELEGYFRLHPENIIVFTGGDAVYFAKRMKNSIFVVCNLVLMGLAVMTDEYVRKINA